MSAKLQESTGSNKRQCNTISIYDSTLKPSSPLVSTLSLDEVQIIDCPKEVSYFFYFIYLIITYFILLRVISKYTRLKLTKIKKQIFQVPHFY